jgi:hypothetical protein
LIRLMFLRDSDRGNVATLQHCALKENTNMRAQSNGMSNP